MTELREIWNQLASTYTDDQPVIDRLWLEIETAYSAPKRYYHNLSHLGYMIGKAMAYRHRLGDFYTLLFSIFYHDIVYDIKRQDNEQRSAELACERLAELGVPADKIEQVKKQIMATGKHETSADGDTSFLVDIDLAILGEDSEVYEAYARKVRREYALYPDLLYNRGRRKLLRHFLDMDHIFKLEEFRNSHEQQARENIKAELKKL